MMDRLWAPWRKAYIRPKKKSRGCLFCRILRSRSDAKHFVLKRSLSSFALLNLYPYNNGHVMIVPNRHVDAPELLTDREKLDWLALSEEIREALLATLRPQGFNLGMNLGCVAGAGVPKHLHWHMVPRWTGDVNFMPVLADTKIISESMDSVYRTLKGYLGAAKKKKKR
jgi:ATP adenylyltransferase